MSAYVNKGVQTCALILTARDTRSIEMMKFTSKVKMPEPLHLRWNKYTGRYDMPEDHRSAGDADLITVGQAEAYANERVKEALEAAEEAVVTLYESEELPYLPDITRVIHALIPNDTE